MFLFKCKLDYLAVLVLQIVKSRNDRNAKNLYFWENVQLHGHHETCLGGRKLWSQRIWKMLVLPWLIDNPFCRITDLLKGWALIGNS